MSKQEKSIYELELNEKTTIDSVRAEQLIVETIVRRVPGGWIYNTVRTQTTGIGMAKSESSVFVPYDTEFRPSGNHNIM